MGREQWCHNVPHGQYIPFSRHHGDGLECGDHDSVSVK